MMLLALLVLFLSSCAGPGIPAGTVPGTTDLFDRVKPVFVMPVSDIDGCNGIEAVFVHQTPTEDGAVLEITVVFFDEDHPSRFVDGLYDAYRSVKYRRVRDVETFFFHFNLAGKEASRFDFPGTYARDQGFQEKKVEHFIAGVPAADFEYIDSRPVIHVTTWNHMFREEVTEPDLVTTAVSEYPVYPGTREMAERLLTR